MTASRFRDVFAARARRVRTALAVRRILDGAVVGAVTAAGAAVLLTAFGKAPWAALAAVPLAMGVAAALAWQRRWSDVHVALFLDARLGGNEAVTSAVCLRDGEAGEYLAAQALPVLGASARPRIFSRAHGVVPAALLVVALAPRFVPARWAPAPRSPERAEKPIRMPLTELRRVEELRELAARTAEERARREAMAEQARALAARAATGVDRREALDALAKLRDAVNAERAERRITAAGRQAAARALAQHAELNDAANAVGRADLVAFDQEMERLARSLEARSRKEAMAALDAAREAAMARGDDELAGALDEQKRLLKERGAESDALKELSRLLGDVLPKETANRLKHLDRETALSTESLAESLAETLQGLTPEERERVAKALAASASGMQSENRLTKAELEELAKALRSADAREELRRALKALANEDPSEASQRERALAAAELSIATAEGRVARSDGASEGEPGASGDDPNGGVSRGGDPGSHGGTTPAVSGSSFVARAGGTPNGGIPLGEVPGLAAVTATGPARARIDALQSAGPRELGAVERSNVPREYRDQVGRYFAP